MVRQWQELFYAERFAQTHLTKQVTDYALLAEELSAARGSWSTTTTSSRRCAPRSTRTRTAVVDARVDPEENCYPDGARGRGIG